MRDDRFARKMDDRFARKMDDRSARMTDDRCARTRARARDESKDQKSGVRSWKEL
jgi:hypothetical protein